MADFIFSPENLAAALNELNALKKNTPSHSDAPAIIEESVIRAVNALKHNGANDPAVVTTGRGEDERIDLELTQALIADRRRLLAGQFGPGTIKSIAAFISPPTYVYIDPFSNQPIFRHLAG